MASSIKKNNSFVFSVSLIFSLVLFGVLLASIALFMTGCTDNTIKIWKATGTEGVSIEFMKNLPPDKVFYYRDSPQPFEVRTFLKNKGGTDTKVSLTFSYDGYYLEKISDEDTNSKAIMQIKGNTEFFPGGDMQDISFGSYKTRLPDQSEGGITQLGINVCYPYTTKMDETVCIDNDIYQTGLRRKACKIGPITLGTKGQGAPIAITKIDPIMLNIDGKIQPVFTLTIENLGQGTVFLTDYIIDSICNVHKPSFRNMSTVRINASLGTRSQLDCFPETVRLIDNKGETVCKLNKNYLDQVGGNSYYTNLHAEIYYNYFQYFEKAVEIVRPY